MVFIHNKTGSLASVFADDLFLVCARKHLTATRATIDAELRIVWGDTLQEGSGWVRYLGKEWQCWQGCYS
eukprot:16050628-Heterocapsa_arctica.AAC.1